MGCGKTTIGRQLARIRGAAFVDLDREIERSAGQKVSDIFARSGEERFRQLEREELERTEDLDRVVVATGGGAFTFSHNVETIRRLGTSVWLEVPWPELERRLDRGSARRPLARDPERTEALYRQRLPWYRQADVQVELDPEDGPTASARRVLDALDQRAVRWRS